MSGKPRYAVELKPGCSPASFMAGHTAVELEGDGARFETDDPFVYQQLLALPFLADAGDGKAKKAAKAEGEG